jgi:hypothetical protein
LIYNHALRNYEDEYALSPVFFSGLSFRSNTFDLGFTRPETDADDS